ncbi:hypothetical protein M3Y97_00460500 [Aphelenchoides bicaudatus]|nr:hypothetical protein M3Y97_00460500 [Aphelenchoides bicaudatus]
MIIDANSEACCSNDVTNDKEIDWKTLTEAELKVTLGRLVDKVKDGQELREKLGSPVTESDCRWPILTQHLCMERLQKQESEACKRASFKIAQCIADTDSKLVRLAFEQLLENCCSNFEDSFDALFQRVATVVDFGRQLKLQKSNDQMLIAEPFFKILQIQDRTSDNNIFRLAFRFAHFLSQVYSINNETFEVNDPIDNDAVARLFNEQPTEQPSNETKNDDRGFELPIDELEEACQLRTPRTVKAFMEAFRNKEDPIEVLVAFECFGQFAPLNRSAVRAQSQGLLSTLLRMENHFNIAKFSSKTNSCIVHVLESDLSEIPEFCQRIYSIHSSIQRMQVVNCIGDLIHQILSGQNQLPDNFDERSKVQSKKPAQMKEIGKVIRKSATLAKPAQKSKPMVDIVEKILKPFMSAALNMDLSSKVDPTTISSALYLICNLQQKQIPGFRRILEEYFLLLANARQISDWTTRLRCTQCYAGLAQMALQPGEDSSEWAQYFQGVDDWLATMTSQSIRQSDRQQHVQLDEFQRSLSAFLGKLKLK